MKFLQDNIKLIVIALFGIAAIIAAATILSIAFGGETIRAPYVTGIDGNAFLQRDNKSYGIDKRTSFKSGDIIKTEKDCTLNVNIDNDKSITIGSDSVLYIYFTSVSDKGDISVNLVNGSVICRLDDEMTKKDNFEVKTPNACINADKSVFRTEFSVMDDYMGYNGVMVSHIQNFGGKVKLQLYNSESEPIDKELELAEKKSAEMITAKTLCKYGYLNYETDMYSSVGGEKTLMKLMEINASGVKTAYSTEELDKIIRSIRGLKTETEFTSETDFEEDKISTPSEIQVTSVSNEAETSETKSTSASDQNIRETTVTTVTTLEDVEYTTYNGPKWWEMPNIAGEENNINEDDVSETASDTQNVQY